MINKNRIVPVTATDLITLYGTILKFTGTDCTAVSGDGTGAFKMTSGSGNVIADEPVKAFDFGSAVTSAAVYFVPAYDYKGFSINGTAVTAGGVAVESDCGTLYKAVLASGAVTISKESC